MRIEVDNKNVVNYKKGEICYVTRKLGDISN